MFGRWVESPCKARFNATSVPLIFGVRHIGR